MIRNFEMADLEEVMAIWLEANLSAHPFIDKNYWINNVDFVKQVLPTSQITVFEESGIIKGFIGIVDQYIAGLFVAQAYQHQGIGTQLLESVQLTYPTLHLEVYIANQQATHFYEQNGFKIIGEKQNMDTHHPEYFMVWNK